MENEPDAPRFHTSPTSGTPPGCTPSTTRLRWSSLCAPTTGYLLPTLRVGRPPLSLKNLPGGLRRCRSQQVFRVVVHPVSAQQDAEFLSKAMPPVVLLLPLNVSPDRFDHACAHTEYRIALLPGELTLVSAGGPYRAGLLQLPNKIGDAVRRLETEQGVHMVLNPANPQGRSTQAAHGPAKILVQSLSPILANPGTTFFGRADPMIMQIVKSRAHGRE